MFSAAETMCGISGSEPIVAFALTERQRFTRLPDNKGIDRLQPRAATLW